MPIAEKEFVIKHMFEGVSNMYEELNNVSKPEPHFGAKWNMYVNRKNDHLELYLCCLKGTTGREWSYDVSYDMKIYSANGKQFSKSAETIIRSQGSVCTETGFPEFIKWDEMMRDYVTDDTMTVEIHVKFKKMTGIKKKNLRNFDESNKAFSDVVLVVEDRKFHVLKLFLAGQSLYFNALLLENSEESKKEKVTLTGINAEDFQNFLEVLHGEPAIDEDTVTGIVDLADKYDTKTVHRQCEEFLMKESEKSLKEKLQLASKYKLEMLKTKCLLKINTIDDVRSVLPGNLRRLDPSLLAELLEKAVLQPN